MMYSHWTAAPWDKQRWPNFRPGELACPCCGEYYHDPATLDMIQAARTQLGKPLYINSGHRCKVYNSSNKIGGAKHSAHLKIAFDINTWGYNLEQLLKALLDAGFTTFGFYGNFIHTDPRPFRRWASPHGEQVWKQLRFLR